MYRVDAAGPRDIEWIARLEREVFSPEDAVPESVLQAWYARNPNGFSVLRDDGGSLAGHLDLLPVRPAPLQKFVDGDIKERDLGGEDLYPDSERARIRNLYLESLAVLPQAGRSAVPALRRLLAEFPSLVDRVAERDHLEKLYAVAATKEGDRLLRSLGFEICRKAGRRPDGHDVFATDFKALQARLHGFGKIQTSIA